MRIGYRVTIETAGIVITATLAVATCLWAGWVIDFAPDPVTFRRVISASIIVGFVLLLCLFVAMVAIWRADVIKGEESSTLHHPLMWSLGAIALYFGVAAISAVDVFYEPAEMWPLMRDPAVQLIVATLVLGLIVAPRAWLLANLLRLRGWPWASIVALGGLAASLAVLVIGLAVTLDGV